MSGPKRTFTLLRMTLCAILLCATAIAGVYLYTGWYGVHVLFRSGGNLWSTVTSDDSRISASMRLALRSSPPPVRAGALSWRESTRGLEVAELDVLAGNQLVDRIFLARVDPSQFRIEVHNSPEGDKEVDDWMKELGAVLVINGSYYERHGRPATPVVSGGVSLGPRTYPASQGALVARNRSAGIIDLRGRSWKSELAGAHDAVVSFPLLLAAGEALIEKETRWLANRSFVAQDAGGRLVFGTTRDAFFSLHRLALFLENSPLELTLALNLDGGPIACQGVAIESFHRAVCGNWELQADGDRFRLLRPVFGRWRSALPIAIAVIPERSAPVTTSDSR